MFLRTSMNRAAASASRATRRQRGLLVGRVLPLLAVAVLAATGLTGCHGGLHAEVVIPDLELPVSFTLSPDGDEIWYAERFTGEIRRRDLTTGEDTLVWTVTNVRNVIEQGLFGVALHPNFPANQLLFAYASRNTPQGPRNQVLRISMSGGVGVSQQVILNDTIGPGDQHNGGRLIFGPDGMLYLSIGDHVNAANAQNLGNTPGKIHRFTPTGAVPAGNPFAGSRIWAYGVRNSFGFGFDPANGRLWVTDNGPECNDELSLVPKGANLAWGATATCATPPTPPANTNRSGPTPRTLPEVFYTDPIAITGAAFCNGCGLGSGAEGDLFVGGANDGVLHQYQLDAGRDDVSSDTPVLDVGTIISIETRPGEPLYFSDHQAIYRVVP